MGVTVASPSSEDAGAGDHHDAWIVAHEPRRRGGTGAQALSRQLARSSSLWRYTDRDATPVALVTVVTVVGADVDPLQSIWRPRPAPTAIVGGVGEGRANERKAIEAVMDEASPVMEPDILRTRARMQHAQTAHLQTGYR